MSFQFTYHKKGQLQKQLSDKTLKSIENRQKLSALYDAREKIEDYQNEVFGIIQDDGLKNDNPKERLTTALKVLPFIAPQKKQVETTIITRKIEDLIREDVEEASYTPVSGDGDED